MNLLHRLFSFLRVSTGLRKQEEVRALRNDRSQSLYLTLRLPQLHTEASGSKIKRPAQGRVSVRVDGLPWKEVRTFDSYAPNDQIFVVNAEDGSIVFGDGVHGSQLPAGVKNVFSSYRVGVASAGNMPSGQEESTSSSTYLVYLDVWTRDITALEDTNIREIALCGPDTSTRRDQGGTEGKMTRVFFVSADFKYSRDSKIIDGTKLAKSLEQAIEQLNKDGFEIVSVMPTTSGFGSYAGDTGAFEYSYGYGYSYTEGIILVARKV